MTVLLCNNKRLKRSTGRISFRIRRTAYTRPLTQGRITTYIDPKNKLPGGKKCEELEIVNKSQNPVWGFNIQGILTVVQVHFLNFNISGRQDRI